MPAGENRVHARVVGVLVARLRGSRGWTQADLASRSELTQTMIARIELGRRELGAYQHRQIALAFGMTSEEFAHLIERAYDEVAQAARHTLPNRPAPWWEAAVQVAGVVGLLGLATFVIAAMLEDDVER